MAKREPPRTTAEQKSSAFSSLRFSFFRLGSRAIQTLFRLAAYKMLYFQLDPETRVTRSLQPSVGPELSQTQACLILRYFLQVRFASKKKLATSKLSSSLKRRECMIDRGQCQQKNRRM